MSIEFKDSNEAIVAIATVIVAADKMGSFSEKEQLFKEFKKLDIFKNYDEAKITKLLGQVTQKVYDILPCEDCIVTTEGFDTLIGAAKKVLSPDLQKKAYEMAIALSASDGVGDEEAVYLNQLQNGFGLNLKGSNWKKAA